MSTIVTRAGKGSPLTHAEVDANFTNLNTDKIESGNTVASLIITSADINGGTVDNATIGGSTPAAGTFTTLTGNSTSQFGRSSDNYIQAVGAATTLSPELSVLGSDTNIPFTIESKGTGAVNLAGGSRGVNISNGGTVTAITLTAAGSNYTTIPTPAITAPTTAGGVQATATATMARGTSTLVSGGTGYTLNDTITVVGGTFTTAASFTVTGVSGGVVNALTAVNGGTYSVLPTGTLSTTGGTGTGLTLTIDTWNVRGFTITNAGSGYVEQPTVTFSGGGGSGAAAYATVGSGTTVRTLGSTMSFSTPGGEQVRINDVAGASRYLILNGSTSNPSMGVSAGALVLYSGSSSNISFWTNNFTQEQLRVAHTASAVNYVQVTGNTTGNGPIISAQGSDTNADLLFSTKGTAGSHVFRTNTTVRQFQVNHVTSAVNYGTVVGSIASAGPVFSVAGTDTNIDLNLTTKGTGAVKFNTGGGEQVRIIDTASAVNYVQLTGAASGSQPRIQAAGNSIPLAISGNGANGITFWSNSFATQQFAVAHTASAVNYVQVTGSATGGAPAITIQGSDTNIAFALSSKGTGNINFWTDNLGARQFQIVRTASTVNYPTVTGSATGAAPAFSVAGTDTNIDLALTPKGTGLVRFGTRTATSDVAITGYIEIKDSGGTTRKLAIID